MNKFTHVRNLSLALLAMGVGLFTYQHLSKNDKVEQRKAYDQIVAEATKGTEKYMGVNIKDIPKLDRPDLAGLQNYLEIFDPATGEVPTERLVKAAKALRKQQQAEQKNARIIVPYWSMVRSDMGGRTRAMFAIPETDYVLAGSVTGGIYKSSFTDVNNEWVYQHVNNNEWVSQSLPISCFAADPISNAVYAGTGEAQTARIIYRESSGVGSGIYVTNNYGSWTQLPSTAGFKYVTDIVIRVEDGQKVIYAGVANGTYHGEQNSEPFNGLVRSEDNGVTWEQVLPTIPDTYPLEYYTPADIELTSDGTMYVSTMVNPDRKGGGKIFKSTTGLNGSWEEVEGLDQYIPEGMVPGRVLLSSCEAHPEVVYAQFAAGYLNDDEGFYYYRGVSMIKTTNAGVNWNPVPIPDESWATLAWHAFVLKVHPEDPNKLYTGGLDLWQTLDGGQEWNRVSNWAAMYYGGGDDYVHADQHSILFHPEDPNKALFATDGGVFYSENVWEYANPKFEQKNLNYSTLQYYTCDIKENNDKHDILGGLQDNGTTYNTDIDVTDWDNPGVTTIEDMITGGDGAYCFFDDNEDFFITSVYYNSYYLHDGSERQQLNRMNSGIFISPADYNSTTNTLFANAVTWIGDFSGSILRMDLNSGDDGNFVEVVSDLGNSWFSAVKLGKETTDDDTHLFLGSNNGRLFKLTHAESEPQTTEITGEDFPIANISSIAIGETEDVIMVTFSNYGVSSVWFTRDGGFSWKEIEGNLPDVPVRWGLIYGDNQGILATELGVWGCADLDAPDLEWFPKNMNLTNVRVDMLQYDQNKQYVLAATHGRGLAAAKSYELIMKDVSVEEHEKDILTMGPNPCRDQLRIQLSSENDYNRYELINVLGQVVKSEDLPAQKEHLLKLTDVTRGNYILRLSGDKKQLSKKLMIEN